MSKQEDLKKLRVDTLLNLENIKFIQFKGATLVSYPHSHGFKPLESGYFATLAYKTFGYGISKGGISDLHHAVGNMAEDWSEYDNFIGFGQRVWDMKKLEWNTSQISHVFSTTYEVNEDPLQILAVKQYLLQLADGDEELARDYLQLLAPLFMYNRPTGVIWVLGAGANGKSAFLNALYKVFGHHFAGLTVEMIEDGRATPALRGILGNIGLEASERRVEDSQKYKNLGSHEPFPVRVLGTHDLVTVDTRFHTIFNANNIPAFNDKSSGSRRRTVLVPFPAKFKDDPDFESRTFTPEFLGAFMHLILEETRNVAVNGYQWSPSTVALQQQYNKDANTAEAFARHLDDDQNVVAFTNYTFLKLHYESWCAAQAMVPLGRSQLRRAIENILNPTEHVYRGDTGVAVRRYIMPGYAPEDITWLDTGYGFSTKSLEDRAEQLELGKSKVNGW